MRPRLVAVLAFASVVSSGCYLGRTPTAKPVAYFVNGLAITAGGITAMTGARKEPCFPGDPSCTEGATLVKMGTAVAVIGFFGVLLNYSVKTKLPGDFDDEPVVPPRPTAKARVKATVNGPSLVPATIELR
ncbi:MAG: hypothetical protein H0T42_28085 [Deltaproteobacteria bacterium]|nr:hypothetical protein [Deltaproteobacteria bacterium]